MKKEKSRERFYKGTFELAREVRDALSYEDVASAFEIHVACFEAILEHECRRAVNELLTVHISEESGRVCIVTNLDERVTTIIRPE